MKKSWLKKIRERKTARMMAKVLAFSFYGALYGTAFASNVPSFYDWRLTDPTDRSSAADPSSIISPVRDQGSYGTCWTFGTFASYESSYMKQLKAAGIQAENPDFSERYLAWTAKKDAVGAPANDLPHYDMTDEIADNGAAQHPVYDTGGNSSQAVAILLRGSIVEESAAPYQYFFDNGFKQGEGTEDYGAADYAEPAGLLHDAFDAVRVAPESDDFQKPLDGQSINDIKSCIMEEGAVYIASNVENIKDYAYYGVGEGEIYQSHVIDDEHPFGGHAEALVGWDDDYIFKHYTGADGSPLKGAFIVRNSWGEDVADGGYGYMSYQDISIMNVTFMNAETDAKRYTVTQNHAPVLEDIYFGTSSAGEHYPSMSIANSYTSEKSQMLKAVMFYASDNNMPYKVIIREGTKPGEGAVIASKEGVFGEDGTAKWRGFRTVDLDEFVFLPEGKEYVVEVTTTSAGGKTPGIALMTDAEYEPKGDSWYYDEEDGEWSNEFDIDEDDDDEEDAASHKKFRAANVRVDEDGHGRGEIFDPEPEYTNVYVFLASRGKETDVANGGDFTVSSLNDDGVGTSTIYLGKSDELYGSDPLHPSRTTLSNMTVNLAGGITNTYGGTITGEGGVIKTGYGTLRLTGENTYTGNTKVNMGLLTINGRLAGDALSENHGVISGSGEIGGTLYNKNIAIAGDAGSGNLTAAALESSGTLVSTAADGTNTKFIIKSDANIGGSSLIVDGSTMPGDKYTVLTASKVSGTPANTENNPYMLTEMVGEAARASGSSVTVSTIAVNNLGTNEATINETFDAMAAMSVTLAGDSRREEMRPFFSMDAKSAKAALASIGSNAAAKSMSIAQKNSLAAHLISSRLSKAFALKETAAKIPAANLADGDDEGITMKFMADQPADDDFWFKYGKNWGELKGSGDYHGTAMTLGYDRAVGSGFRAGAFVSHGWTGFSDDGANNEMKDTRLGLYAGHQSGANESFVYLDYGWMKNHLRRNLVNLGLGTDARYHGHIVEIGGEYKYDTSAGKETPWHISPYINAQMSRLWQDGYSESGAGVFGQRVSGKTNDYFAGGVGVELRRYLINGDYAIRLGAKHAFAGADPKLRFGYAGDDAHSYEMGNNQDKTHLVLSVGGEAEFAPGWTLAGEAGVERGAHDRDMMCAVTLRRMW